MARTWSSAVIGLSTLTVSGTVLPFSDSGGSSTFTLPEVTGAVPTTFRMDSSIAAGVASAGVLRTAQLRLRLVAATFRKSRRSMASLDSILECRQEGHHVLDLLRG